MDRTGPSRRTTPWTLRVRPVAPHETGWPAPPHSMSEPPSPFADRNLARAAIAGPWQPAAIAARLRRAAGGRPRGLAALARRLVTAFPAPPSAEQLVPALRA